MCTLSYTRSFLYGPYGMYTLVGHLAGCLFQTSGARIATCLSLAILFALPLQPLHAQDGGAAGSSASHPSGGSSPMQHGPNDSQLIILPTARATGAGEGRFTVYDVFLPYVDIGITDEVSASAGTVLAPGFVGSVMYFSPKITLHESSEQTFAIGSSGGYVPGGNSYLGLSYGLATLGSSSRALTIGGGLGFSSIDELDGTLMILVGGELQVSNSVKLISENVLAPNVDGGAYLSGGVRFFGERTAGTFGVATLPSMIGNRDVFPFIPILSFSYNL